MFGVMVTALMLRFSVKVFSSRPSGNVSSYDRYDSGTRMYHYMCGAGR